MKYFIATYGCQANYADAERISRRLEDSGHKKTGQIEKADLLVLNACSVRQSAMHRVYSKINKFGRKKIILAGCVLPADRKKLAGKVAEIWHPDEYFDLAPVYSNPASANVPVMSGCNNFCSYCAVPLTRGREKSRPAGEIIAEIKNLVAKKYKEIWLLGQNVNSYQSKNINFPKLLKSVNAVPGEFKINFLTSHPKDMSDELIKTMASCGKVSKEMHLPLQSGDGRILEKMNRHYTPARYKNLVRKIRREIAGVKISTDIIVGFPGETKKQFQNTLKLCQQIKFDKAYVARYSPRPGTAAAKLADDVPLPEKKRRWQILENLINKPNLGKK